MDQNFEKNLAFYDFFQVNDNPMWVYDIETLAFMDVNENANIVYGYSKEEFLQMTIRDISKPQFQPQLEANIEGNFPNFKKTDIWQHQHKNGKTIYAKISHFNIQYKNRGCKLITAIDQTEQVYQNKNLKTTVRNLELLSLVAKHTNNLVLILDKNGGLNWCNQAFTKVMEYELFEIKGKNTNDFLFGNLLHNYNENHLTILIKEKKAFSIEILQYSKTGKKIWILANGEPILDDKNELKYFVIVETDITIQRKNESIIKRSEYELNAFFNNIGSLHILFNKNLIVTNYNSKAELISKNILKTHLKKGEPVLQSVPDTNKKDFIHFATLALNGVSTTNREIHLAGIDQWWDLKYEPIYDGFNTVIGASFTAYDITEKKQAALNLQTTNDRLKWALKATSDAIWDWDIKNNKVYRGDGFFTLFGLNPQEMQNNATVWDNLIYEEDRERVIKDFDEKINSESLKWVCEYRFIKMNGSYAHVLDKALIIRDELGKAVRVVGAMQDISEQKIREKQLNLYESVITNTNDGVIITDIGVKGKKRRSIVYVNDAICKITGYTKEELIGKSPSIFQGIKSDKEEIKRFNEKLANWEKAEMDIIDYRKNGDEMWMNISAVPITDEKGNYTNWISIQKDITKRKKRQLEREQLINHLTKTNRELEQFSYITSHNLRAPLTNLLAISNLINEDEIEDQRNKDLILAFKKSTNLLNTTLNDLIRVLIIKENSNQEIEKINIEQIFSNTTLSLSRIIKNANATINFDFTNAPTIDFNLVYLESIFINLLSNSLKYRKLNIPLEINVISKPTKTGVELYFQDNGIGMDPQRIKDKIFGLYQKFSDNKDSKGIGLYLVHSQITSLGGDIQINTNLGVGTTFILIFKPKNHDSHYDVCR